MTREEAIEKLELMRQKVDEETYRALILAIKALEQQPCDDAISREAVYEMVMRADFRDGFTYQMFKDRLDKVPSVQPSRKGHWIGIDEEPHEDYECDKCGYVCSTFTVNIKPSDEYKFCPNCGADMRGDTE